MAQKVIAILYGVTLPKKIVLHGEDRDQDDPPRDGLMDAWDNLPARQRPLALDTNFQGTPALLGFWITGPESWRQPKGALDLAQTFRLDKVYASPRLKAAAKLWPLVVKLAAAQGVALKEKPKLWVTDTEIA